MVTPQHAFRDMAPDALAPYLAEIRHKPLLTPEAEVELGRRIAQGDEEALHTLVEGNLRFVLQIALQYRGRGLALSDLINEGNLGLIHAARKFDPERGTRFITYAVWWIRQAMLQALASGGRAVRLSPRQAESLAKLRRQFEILHHEQGVEPTVEALAQALEMPPDEVIDLLRVYHPQLSLDEPILEDGDVTRLEALPAHDAPSGEASYAHASMLQEMQHLLQDLEPRQAAIVRARFGFEGEPKSLAEIGRELGLSRERVRQLEAQARRRLKVLAKAKDLDEYLE